MIKKCNDFGAGGVSVAIGELAVGLKINLDTVPKKYAGLDGTELAISESQERMAVVIDPKDVDAFMEHAAKENLEATCVAEVTESPRLVMQWRGKTIVDISRAFLDTNGAHQENNAYVTLPNPEDNYFKKEKDVTDMKKAWLSNLSDLNVCSQKGLVEMFDSSIGASSVYMPYGGKYQLTPAQSMIAKIPVLKGKCDTVTMMSYGFDPYLSTWSPYHGAIYAVVQSVAKIVAAGGDLDKIHFTFQEYFRRMTDDPITWGEPLSALLGAYNAQIGFGLASIGGKDSMSGSFNEMNVPPTLVSFAVDVAKQQDIVSSELKAAGNKLVVFSVKKDEYDLPDYEQMLDMYRNITKMVNDGVLKSTYTVGFGGIAEAVSKMAFGNKLGVAMNDNMAAAELFKPYYGDIVAEVAPEDLDKVTAAYTVCGTITEASEFTYKDMKVSMDEALAAWTQTLEEVFPTKSGVEEKKIETGLYTAKDIYICKHKVAKPKVFIPVFPGTNCEYDTMKAFEKAGADVEMRVFRNLNEGMIRDSVDEYVKAINNAQILMFPGGFSAGDEPDGSAKFIASVFRNEKIKEAVNQLLNQRDGLALGICNGFQALIKLGLVPYGEITPQKEDSPTLTTNHIGRHISKKVYTQVVTNKTPWLQKVTPGDVFAIPASHGEGRFVANEEWIKKLFETGCVATQYVDVNGNPTMDEDFNPNGSYFAIEGITSPDGRVLGKMAHSERIGDHVAMNITGNQNQHLFESGVE